MATYKGIQGYSVQKLSSDPTASEAEGQLWYNSTSANFKVGVAGAGAWASGANLNAKRFVMASAGTETTNLCISGGQDPGVVTLVEQYNGTAWSEQADVNNATDYLTGFGSSTAAIKTGGITPSPTGNTESWNGTSWTETNDLNTARGIFAGAGTQTAGMVFTGNPYTDLTETWDGTSWAEDADLNTVRQSIFGCGIQTAALAMGGNSSDPVRVDLTESWNGTSWTEVNDLNTARDSAGSTGQQTSALVYGGNSPPYQTVTEAFDGTSWTELADLAQARYQTGSTPASGTGSSGAALCFGGSGIPPTSTSNVETEEWNGAPVTAKTVTVS